MGKWLGGMIERQFDKLLLASLFAGTLTFCWFLVYMHTADTLVSWSTNLASGLLGALTMRINTVKTGIGSDTPLSSGARVQEQVTTIRTENTPASDENP